MSEAEHVETEGGLEPSEAGWFESSARKHGAGVDEETRLPADAYARFTDWKRTRPEDLGLPWQ